MVFHASPCSRRAPNSQYAASFFAYAQHFDIVPQSTLIGGRLSRQKSATVEPYTGMYILKRARRSDGTVMGDIIPLGHVKRLVDLILRFGAIAEKRLTKETSLEYTSEFRLNSYFDKELFYSLNHL